MLLFRNKSVQSVSALRCRPSFARLKRRQKRSTLGGKKSLEIFSTSAVVASSFIRQKCYIRLNSCSLTVCSSASEVIATTRRLSIVPTAMGIVLNSFYTLHLIKCLGHQLQHYQKNPFAGLCHFLQQSIISCRNREVSLGEYKKSDTYFTLYH